MGKTKIKTIDDSVQEEVKREPKAKRAQKEKTDSLVEKLKAELGVEEKLDVGSEKIEQESKLKHPTSKSKPRSKKHQQALAQTDQTKSYALKEAVELAQKTSYTKFPGTVEAHINTNTKNTRILISLPSGKVELKSEPNGNIIHLAVGKVSQSADEVGSNIKALYNSLGKSKVKKITLSATMGPGVKVDLGSI